MDDVQSTFSSPLVENRLLDLFSNVTQYSSKMGFTFAPLISASGKFIYKFVIIKGGSERSAKKYNFPSDFKVLYSTKTGWMNEKLMLTVLEYISIYTMNRRCTLIVDHYGSHLTNDVKKLCEEKNIHLVIVPKQQTGSLQPLDVGIFGPLKSKSKHVQKEIYHSMFLYPNNEMNLLNWHSLSVWRLVRSLEGISSDCIKSAFNKILTIDTNT